jgi:hypothetical protein
MPHRKRILLTIISLLSLVSVRVSQAQALPSDVNSFVERRKSCDRWRGEDGYNNERQRQINQALCKTCSGTDAQLKRLKRKYATNAEAMRLLNGFDIEIEPKEKLEGRHFCKQARRGVQPKSWGQSFLSSTNDISIEFRTIEIVASRTQFGHIKVVNFEIDLQNAIQFYPHLYSPYLVNLG